MITHPARSRADDSRPTSSLARANPLALYFREIGAVDRLTAAQER